MINYTTVVDLTKLEILLKSKVDKQMLKGSSLTHMKIFLFLKCVHYCIENYICDMFSIYNIFLSFF